MSGNVYARRSFEFALTDVSSAVVVFEDIDAALPSDNASLTRKKLAKSPEDAAKSDSKNDAENEDGKGGRVTLSGILNSIDGIGGGDGRVLFMTS